MMKIWSEMIFTKSEGRVWVGYKKNDQRKVVTFPGFWINFKNVVRESINFEHIYIADQRNGQNFKKNNKKVFL